MTNEHPKSSGPAAETKPFHDLINPLLAGLLYPSESDEPLEPITCYLTQPQPLTPSQVKDWQLLPPSVCVEEIDEAEFWEPVIREQDWYGNVEKERTARFGQLKKFIETELTGRQVFRAGQTEIDLYLLGQQKNGERAGIKTKIIET